MNDFPAHAEPELSIILLAYNEAENIGPVIDELVDFRDAENIPAKLLIVDDGSGDGTAAAARAALERHRFPSARPRGRVLPHAENRGMGAGIKTGATAAQTPWVTFLPADGQIPPAAVAALWRARGGADLVLSVYDHRDDGALRKLLSLGVRGLILLVHGVVMRSDGPYLFKRTLLDPSQLAPDTFFLNFELPIRAKEAQLHTNTVTVSVRPRRSGQSKTARPGKILGVAKDLFALRRRRLQETLSHWR